MKRKLLPGLVLLAAFSACSPHDNPYSNENASTFTEISSTDLGEAGAAEISAYDPLTKKLFVVTNSGSATRIDVIDLSNPSLPVITNNPIDISPFGGGVNSVSVFEGKLAAAIEATPKTNPGKVVVFKTTDHSVVKEITVGALPDMITYTYDGKYILTANEGEPADDYAADPAGTVSIISVRDNYAVSTIDFSGFASQQAALETKGFRIFGPNTGFAANIEPEYLTISSDSRTAWVTLQENNAIAKIDIRSKCITHIFPLGFKNYDLDINGVDPSDRDSKIEFRKIPVKGMFQPDGIAVYEKWGKPYLFSANEGDVREWTAFAENKRVKDLALDPTAFPDAATLKLDPNIGRLNVTSTLGNTDGDTDYDALYSFGARSFSVWNGFNGQLVFDSENELEEKALAAVKYDDARSDDKGVEPEGITLGYIGNRVIAFVGMERADLVALYDVTDPQHPVFIKSLPTGDAPEGLLFIPAKYSPSNKSLLVVSSEGDGTVKVYQTN
ncbi:MAG TPA: choice-of-anchor I family protein [Chitinophagaceae bacterium]